MDVSQRGLKSYLGVDTYARSMVVESIEASEAVGSIAFVAHDFDWMLVVKMLLSGERWMKQDK